MADSGVVDPIRVPDWLREPAERWWRETPTLARLFAGLAALDIVGRSLGFLQPAIDWAYLTPLAFVTAFLPHDIWILLPALLLIRRPDAAAVTPWVFRGAIVVAVVELVRGPLGGLLYAPGTATVWALLGAAAMLALGAGWLLLGRGLAALRAGEPTQAAAGLANLGAAFLAVLAAYYLAETIVAPGVDVGDPGYSQAITLGNLASPIQVLAWAYLVRVVIRGYGDPRRPAVATTIAAAGAIMAAFIVTVTSVLARILVAVQVDLVGGSGFGEVFQIVSWLGDIAGPALIAAAFAVGLAEPPTPYVAAAPAAPDEPVPPAAPDEPAGATTTA